MEDTLIYGEGVECVALQLFEHNEKAYQKAARMLEAYGRAAVIHPTGTGKSFIAFQLIADHPKASFLWLSPNEYIFESQRRNACSDFGNVLHMTYTRLMRMAEEQLEELCPEYIVLDEFHRCGAYCWGVGVEGLLEKYPNAKVLGLSATPIRYLDNCRNMAEELFSVDGRLCVASEMTLGEAIVRGILPAPLYVTTMFQYQQELQRYQKRIDWLVPQGMKEMSQRRLDALRRALGQADGLEKIFFRYLKKNGKYLLFCTDWAHLQQIKTRIPNWFCDVDHKPHIYCLYAGAQETEAEYEEFLADQSEHLKLLLCINRLNEGVHVADIDGVILFRLTSSPILYKQQIGRALTTGAGEQPLILDVVNNFDSLSSIGTIRVEMEDAVCKLRCAGEEKQILIEQFQVEEQVEDSIRLVRELENTLNNTWDVWYAEACAYFSAHGNLKVPRRYLTESGMQLGAWVQAQRAIFNGKGRGELSAKHVEALNAIGMEWGNALDAVWNETWKQAQEYYRINGNLLVPDSLKIGETDLGKWIAYQRNRKKNGKLSSERTERLNEIGMVWDAAEAKWEQRYTQAKAYFEANADLNVPSGYRCEDGFLLGMWVAGQRRAYVENRLTAAQTKKLTEVGMVWDRPQSIQWQNAYHRAEEYYRQNGNLNIPYTYCTADGYKLGRWLARQKSARKEPGKSSNCVMTSERAEKLEKIGIVWDAAGQKKGNWP